MTSSSPQPTSSPRPEGIMWKGRCIRGILFDMDGVLADTRHAHFRAWQSWAEAENRTMTREEFEQRFFGLGNNEVFAILFPDRVSETEFLMRKADEKERLYRERVKAGEVIPLAGVEQFLRKARQSGLRLAVGSSAPRANIEALLVHFGWDDYFDEIVGSEDVTHCKPDPEIFLLAAEKLGLSPAECLVFEDSLPGLRAARAAGCPAIGVTTLHTSEELAPFCEISIADFMALPHYFED